MSNIMKVIEVLAESTEGVMSQGRGRAAPRTGRMQGAATRRGGSTARSCNTAGGRLSGLPSGFGREGTHCGVAALASDARSERRAAPSTASLLDRTRPLPWLITPSQSWEDAVTAAVVKASESVHGIRSVYVKEFEAQVDNNKVVNWRINAKVTFEVD